MHNIGNIARLEVRTKQITLLVCPQYPQLLSATSTPGTTMIPTTQSGRSGCTRAPTAYRTATKKSCFHIRFPSVALCPVTHTRAFGRCAHTQNTCHAHSRPTLGMRCHIVLQRHMLRAIKLQKGLNAKAAAQRASMPVEDIAAPSSIMSVPATAGPSAGANAAAEPLAASLSAPPVATSTAEATTTTAMATEEAGAESAAPATAAVPAEEAAGSTGETKAAKKKKKKKAYDTQDIAPKSW